MVQASSEDDRLTKKQREVVITAVKEGYFDTPRRTSLVGVSETVDMSDVEAYQQLHTGIDTIMRDYFHEEFPRED